MSVSAPTARQASTIPALVADSYAFLFDNPDPDVLCNKLSENMIKKLQSALNFSGSKVEKLLANRAVKSDKEVEFKHEVL
jgi:hypothetical protein